MYNDTDHPRSTRLQGIHAILGMDVVSFSTLEDDDQVTAVEALYTWIRQAIRGEGLVEADYRWSPAGDGGYLTFATQEGCSRAIDIAFSILKKSHNPAWTPRNRSNIQLRFALHVGMIQEGKELGGRTNIWGFGINRTARIVMISSPSQILVSKEYFDQYIGPRRKKEFQCGEPYARTVKHGEQIEVMNIAYGDYGLANKEASANCWHAVTDLREKTKAGYELLIEDAMRSGNPLAALAAAKLLLDLYPEETVKAVDDLCRAISDSSEKLSDILYPPQHHKFFSHLPRGVLHDAIERAKLKVYERDERICERGEEPDFIFFLVSGIVRVEGIPGVKDFDVTRDNEILGEFSLWEPTIKRTATLRALNRCLLLAIDIEHFRKILDEHRAVSTVIYGIIKRRIIDNVMSSSTLLVNIKNSTYNRKMLSIFNSAICEKYESQEKQQLNLEERVYVIFNGEVEINPTNKSFPILIEGNGEISAKQVIGIASDNGEIDGKIAKIIKDAVIVSFDRKRLQELQEECLPVAEHWNGLHGRRYGQIAREEAKITKDLESVNGLKSKNLVKAQKLEELQ